MKQEAWRRWHGALTRSGFSLLEVVIALTILALISTTLFAIIKGSVKGASDIERLQRENDELNRFLELCRQTFQMMPSSATFKLTALGQMGSDSQELEISGVPFSFGFGASPISYEATTLTLRPNLKKPTTEDGVNRYDVCISRKDIIPATGDNQMMVRQGASDTLAADDQGRYWMPVLPGVVLMKWRFFKDSTDEWMEEWTDAPWPELIELQLQMEGRNLPIRMVWATPETQLRSATNKTSTTPATPTVTNGPSTPTASGAGGNGGGGSTGGGGGGGTAGGGGGKGR